MWGNIKIYLFRFGQSLPLTKTIVTLKCMSSFLGVPVWMIWVCNTSTLLWHKGLPLAQHVKKQINSKSQTLVPRLNKSLNCIAKLYSVTGIMFTECLQPRSMDHLLIRNILALPLQTENKIQPMRPFSHLKFGRFACHCHKFVQSYWYI